jgi:hypothetical protein
MKLHIERRSPFNIDPNIAHQHQQTAIAILRVTFVRVAKQQMSSLRAEDLAIQTPPHNAFLSAGITHPGQPGAYSGGGGGGSIGLDCGGLGGNSAHGRSSHGRRKGDPASFGVIPTSTALPTNAVLQPRVSGSLYVESERRKQRFNSLSEREEKMDVEAAAQNAATPAGTSVEDVYSDYEIDQ